MPAPSHPAGPAPLLAIVVGGSLGTLARWGVAHLFPVASSSGFPWATFAVNVVGSFLLGAVVTVAVERRSEDHLLRPFAAVGFCGGFTTFSTFVVEIDRRIRAGHDGLALTYLWASLVVGLLAAAAGMALMHWGAPAAPRSPEIADPDSLGDEVER